MASYFRVTPRELRDTATKVQAEMDKLKTTENTIYSKTLTDLKVQWQGESSDAYNRKLSDYRPAFTDMFRLLSSYKDALLKAAAKYEQEEGSIKGQASSLPVK